MAWIKERNAGWLWDFKFENQANAEIRSRELSKRVNKPVKVRPLQGSDPQLYECYTLEEIDALPFDHSNLCRCPRCVPVLH